MPTAVITGITGQDGSYLTELLLRKGFTVHGLVRRQSTTVRQRLDHFYNDPTVYNRRLYLHYADLHDTTTIRRLLLEIEPDQLYHLAGQSHVGISFDIPESTCELTAMCTLRLLEVLRDLPHPPRLLHISSSEIFGRPRTTPQDEETPLSPVSPYGVAKAFATQMVRVYRESHGFFACNAICYNHESPRRGENFVTRKITLGAARIKLGLAEKLQLGNLDARRDWGFAGDYVDAMWRMLERDEPDDYVLATGQSHSVRDFLELAFRAVDLDWQHHVEVDSQYLRPSEVHQLVGNSQKARSCLDWHSSVSLPELVRMMVEHDLSSVDTTLSDARE